MAITIHIETDGAAFVEFGGRPEVARILREIADKIEQHRNPEVIREVNGNRCGYINVEG